MGFRPPFRPRARAADGRRRNFVGQPFGARGYGVLTVGQNEAAVRWDIPDQEKADQRLEPLAMAALGAPPDNQ